ncbi:MAG: glycosyltransferase family 39 protein [Candidatus Pacearchaeota archaeon]|jgi:4-amino-4-deoxy-L-arabinose transferase-like glycosyltransferase
MPEENQNQDKSKKGFIDKSVDFFFSKDPRKWLVLILILGFILRLIVILNVSPIADEMVHGTHAINIISSGVINVQNESPVWFYLEDIAYKLFGVNALGARFLSLLFGTLTILVVYLIAKELFNEKIALISSFLLAISAFAARYALMEMDPTLIFFVLLSFYFFIKEWSSKKQISYLAVIFMGVAILTKPIPITFIPGFAIFFLFVLFKSSKEERKEIIKKNKSRIVIAIILLLLFSMPILTYNYILHQEKGITDVVFSRFFKINQTIYSGLAGFGQNDTFDPIGVITRGIPFIIFDTFIPLDPFIFILGLLGIVLIFVKKEYFKGRFFVLYHLIPLIFIMGTQLLQTHLVSFVPLFALTGGAFIFFLSEIISSKSNTHKIKAKHVVTILLLVVLIANLVVSMPHLTNKSAVFKMRDFAISSIDKQDFVIVDSRIYRGRIAWMFNDKSYLEAADLSQILDINAKLPGNQVSTNAYFIECAADDCGWGTVLSQKEFNESMESMVGIFKNNSIREKVITGSGDNEASGDYFVVYKTQIALNPAIYSYIYDTHEFFYYPVRWEKNNWYDRYTPDGTIQILLNILGKWVLWIAIVLAILAPFFLIPEIIPEIRKKK